ncbi:MAG TPA: hypothetical protein VK179_16045 [Bacteroidales bacterium]|nr:hypothetical protein [Bacteroidales bacterium]
MQRISGSSFMQERRFITFFFFVLLSAAFWFIRSLGEQYESRIDYPVRYINFPEDKVLVGDVPYKLHLTVRAKGFSILRSKLNLDLVPLRFDINSFSLDSKGVDTFFVVTESVKDILSAELKEMTILNIAPDTLFFKLTGIEVKKVPVRPVLAMNNKFFRQQFMLNGRISVDPDSIIISGPALIIDSVNHVETVPISYTNLADTVTTRVNLKSLNMITFSQQKVAATIPVDRFTEVEQRLTIVPVNVPDSLNLIAIPGQVSATFRITLSNYNKVINMPLVPMVDYKSITGNSQPRLTVFLDDTPDYVINLRFNPKATEFIITRK